MLIVEMVVFTLFSKSWILKYKQVIDIGLPINNSPIDPRQNFVSGEVFS